MKFLFIQKSGMPWHGIMSLSSVLTDVGCENDLILTDIDKPIPSIRKFRPNYIGFPVITGEHRWVSGLCREIKESFPEVKSVFGGPHATFYPETLDADHVVVGEGEQPLVDLITLGSFTNHSRPIENLDSLPLPNREIYYKYPHLAKSSVKQFLTGRGCPYKCTFCSNCISNVPVRRRSPEAVILEIMQVQSKWGFKTISFTDDIFTLNMGWLRKFLDLYKVTIKVPFMCNTRFNLVNEELLELLAGSGCYGLEMGIESGSQRIRQDILKKGKESNGDIIRAGKLIKEFGLKLKTYNMVGIPTETIEDAFNTIKLNTEINPDQASCSFLIPYPKYEISKYYPDGIDIPDSIYKPPKWLGKEFVNLQTFFLIGTKFPKLIPTVKLLIKLPPNPLYRLLALIIYGYFMAKSHKLTPMDMIRYARHISPFRI